MPPKIPWVYKDRLAARRLYFRNTYYTYRGTVDSVVEMKRVVRFLNASGYRVRVNRRIKGTKFWAGREIKSSRGGQIIMDIYAKKRR